MNPKQDKEFFRTYSIILGLLAIMIVILLIIARIIGVDQNAEAEQRADKVSEVTQPVGAVSLPGDEAAVVTAPVAAAPAPAAPEDVGKQVYSGLCFSCHGTGLPGIPQLGDQAAWVDRIAQGSALLYERALKGFTGSSGIMMPAKGGNAALSDEQVKAAVDYMVANSQ